MRIAIAGDSAGAPLARALAEHLKGRDGVEVAELSASPGGTGEFFSLTGDEYPGIIKTAVDTCRGVMPIIAGAGGPTRFAIQCAQAAEKAGAHGVLLLHRLEDLPVLLLEVADVAHHVEVEVDVAVGEPAQLLDQADHPRPSRAPIDDGVEGRGEVARRGH